MAEQLRHLLRRTLCVLLGHQYAPGPSITREDRIESQPCIHCGHRVITSIAARNA